MQKDRLNLRFLSVYKEFRGHKEFRSSRIPEIPGTQYLTIRGSRKTKAMSLVVGNKRSHVADECKR